MQPDNSNYFNQRQAIVLPADGTLVRLVPYNIKQRSDGDGSVDFYEHIPDLRPWLEPAFPERDFVDFQVRDFHPQHSDESLRSGNPTDWGNYCLYYTTSSKLPVNQSCKDMIKCDPPAGRLFFRGDVLLIKHSGSLGMGHEYIDTPQTMADIAAKVIQKMYENMSLEKKLESDRMYERAEEEPKRRHPDLYTAVETGAIERLRTGQMTENDMSQIALLLKYKVVFPDGTFKGLLG